jgi:hypothetical protein
MFSSRDTINFSLTNTTTHMPILIKPIIHTVSAKLINNNSSRMSASSQFTTIPELIILLTSLLSNLTCLTTNLTNLRQLKTLKNKLSPDQNHLFLTVLHYMANSKLHRPIHSKQSDTIGSNLNCIGV